MECSTIDSVNIDPIPTRLNAQRARIVEASVNNDTNAGRFAGSFVGSTCLNFSFLFCHFIFSSFNEIAGCRKCADYLAD